jgi:O-antigen/teichoic acid export membrane protein
MLKRVAHAFLAFFFGQGLGIAAALLLVPLYLHVWSPALYGEWLALYSVVAYLSSFDLGVQTYAVNRLTQAYARGDLQEYRRVQHTAFAFYFCLALLGSVALTAFGWWAPIGLWFHLSLTGQHSVALIVLLLGGQFLWTIPASLVWSVYATTGNLAKTQWVTNAASSLSVALTAAALLFWPRLVVVAGAQAFAFISMLAVVWWDVRKHYSELAPGFSEAKPSLLRSILSQSVFFALIDIGVGTGLQGSNIIVARVAGAAALALFVTTRTLANSVRQIVNTFVHSTSTDLTRLEALHDEAQLRLAFRLVVFATAGACVAISGSLWYEGTAVLEVWTRGRLAPDLWLLRAFLAWLVLQSPWITASSIPQYTNQHRLVAVAFFASNVAGLALSALLVPRFGPAAIPISFTVAEAVFCYHWVIRDACRIAAQPYFPFALKLWGGLACLTVLSLVATSFVHGVPGLGLLTRCVASGAASVMAVGFGTFLFWLRAEERRFLRDKSALAARYLGRMLMPHKATEAA